MAKDFRLPLAFGAMSAGLAYLFGKKQKKKVKAKKQQIAQVEAEEESIKAQITYHKTAKTSIADKDHPDWHMNNFKQMNLERQLAKDDNLPELSVESYRDQFMKDVYKPEDYTSWGNVQASNTANTNFMPTDEQKELGEAYIQFQRESILKDETSEDIKGTGEKLETDIEARLNRMEKQKYVTEIYNFVQNKTEEEITAKYPGITPKMIGTMKTTGSVKGILTGQDADVPPVWTEKDQKQYVNLVRTYNQAQKARGSDVSYSLTQGRSRAEQLVNMGMIEGDAELTDPDVIAEGEKKLAESGPKFLLSPQKQAVIDSLETSLGDLELKYSDKLSLQFEEVKRKIKYRDEENK